MSTEEPSRVSQRENAHQAAILSHQRAPDVLRRQMFEDAIDRLTHVDDVGVRNEDIANEQLLFPGQSEGGLERSLEVAVRQHANESVAILHRKMTNLVLNHQGSGCQHAL